MGHEDHGGAAGGHQRQHLVLQALPRHRVERAERLVHQQRLRLLREAARDLQPLLHAAGHFSRIFAGVTGQADRAQQFLDAGRALGRRHAARFQRQRDVAGRGAPRQQRLAVVLKHDRDLAARLQHRLAVEIHLAAGRLIEPGGQPQRRGLAAAGGADDAEEFAGPHAKAQILDDGLAAEFERDIGKRDLRLRDGRTTAFPGVLRRSAMAFSSRCRRIDDNRSSNADARPAWSARRRMSRESTQSASN